MKKAVLKGAAAAVILAAWLVLPNVGAHGATVQDTELGLVTADDIAACNKFGKVAENVAIERDAKTAAAALHEQVDTFGLDPEPVAYLHKTIDRVYSVPDASPSIANVLTSAMCRVEAQEWREEHNQKAAKLPRTAPKGSV